MMVMSSSQKYWIKKWNNTKVLLPYGCQSHNKIGNGNVRNLFRDIKKKLIKLIETKSHRAFNECCLNSKLLPYYTNIYINKIIELPQFSCYNKNEDSFGVLETFPTKRTFPFLNFLFRFLLT